MRNSVKVVIDAYSGKMTFYDADPKDPILQAYSAAFPNMFVPLSKMPTALQAHLRYPEDIFSIQSAIYGRYHLTNPQAFYSASSAWQLSPTAGAGPQSQALLAENTYNNQGQLVSTTPARMAPQYQVYSLPGTSQNKQVFTVSDGFVPASQSSLTSSGQNFNLTAWMVGLSDPGTLGHLDLYETPQGTTGPANADAEISADSTVSKDISLLDTKGSEVLLGETLMVPIANSMVYVRPLYVSPTTNPQPQLEYVIAVLGKNVQIDTLAPERPLGPAGNDGAATRTGRDLDRHGAGGGGGDPPAGPDRLHQRAGGAQGRQPVAVPDRHRPDAGGDQPGPAGDRRNDAGRDDRPPPRRRCRPSSRRRRRSGATTTTTSHASTTSSTTTSVPTSTEPKNTTTTSTLREHHLVDTGLGGTQDLRGGGPALLACREANPQPCDSGCGRGRAVP